MKQNLRSQILENLEKDIWPSINVEEDSYLIKACNSLRKKPLTNFSIEDLRIMIGQNIGLKFLIPLAVEKLSENILAEGDFYPGDLLVAVLDCDVEF